MPDHSTLCQRLFSWVYALPKFYLISNSKRRQILFHAFNSTWIDKSAFHVPTSLSSARINFTDWNKPVISQTLRENILHPARLCETDAGLMH